MVQWLIDPAVAPDGGAVFDAARLVLGSNGRGPA
jgi:hypothetical protein